MRPGSCWRPTGRAGPADGGPGRTPPDAGDASAGSRRRSRSGTSPECRHGLGVRSVSVGGLCVAPPGDSDGTHRAGPRRLPHQGVSAAVLLPGQDLAVAVVVLGEDAGGGEGALARTDADVPVDGDGDGGGDVTG